MTGRFALAVRVHISEIESFRKREIALNGSALPRAGQSVLQLDVDLGAVKRAISFVYLIDRR